MEVMQVELEQMISASPLGTDVFSTSANGGNAVLSKRRNVEVYDDEPASDFPTLDELF